MAFAAHIDLPLSARSQAMRHKGEMLHQGNYHITVCAICCGCDAREVPGDAAAMGQLVREGWECVGIRGTLGEIDCSRWICPTCAAVQRAAGGVLIFS
jgi:hypothetical protein